MIGSEEPAPAWHRLRSGLRDGTRVAQKMMNPSSSLDQRVVHGAQGGRQLCKQGRGSPGGGQGDRGSWRRVPARQGEPGRPQGSARDGQAGGREVRSPRHPGQQRRHHARLDVAAHERRAVAGGDPDQPQRPVLLHLGRDPVHVGTELRTHRQHQLDERPGCGHGPGQLQRQQGRHDCLHAHRGDRAGALGHHGQRRCPGLHRNRHVRLGAGGDPGADQVQDSVGSLCTPARDRQGRALPGGRRRLHHR